MLKHIALPNKKLCTLDCTLWIVNVVKTQMKAKQQYGLTCAFKRRRKYNFSISKGYQQDLNEHNFPLGQN